MIIHVYMAEAVESYVECALIEGAITLGDNDPSV